ncbi:hypothetical protein KJ918_02865, partial [Patescibacteria group bacterium]|nr:hypothetical protein [Patescibacteria group bacterium]
MKTKILIILIVLIGLGVGGYFVWKNIFQSETEKRETGEVIPRAYQLNVPRVFTGGILKDKETGEAPGLCYLGAFAMLALFDDPDLDFTEIVAYSGIGVTAKNVVLRGLANDFLGNSIITGVENLGYNFGLGLLSGGKDSISDL